MELEEFDKGVEKEWLERKSKKFLVVCSVRDFMGIVYFEKELRVKLV